MTEVGVWANLKYHGYWTLYTVSQTSEGWQVAQRAVAPAVRVQAVPHSLKDMIDQIEIASASIISFNPDSPSRRTDYRSQHGMPAPSASVVIQKQVGFFSTAITLKIQEYKE